MSTFLNNANANLGVAKEAFKSWQLGGGKDIVPYLNPVRRCLCMTVIPADALLNRRQREESVLATINQLQHNIKDLVQKHIEFQTANEIKSKKVRKTSAKEKPKSSTKRQTKRGGMMNLEEFPAMQTTYLLNASNDPLGGTGPALDPHYNAPVFSGSADFSATGGQNLSANVQSVVTPTLGTATR